MTEEFGYAVERDARGGKAQFVGCQIGSFLKRVARTLGCFYYIDITPRVNAMKGTDISVVLYNMRSIYNVASIFRTCAAAGIAKIYLVGITPSPVDALGKIRPQFAKVSLGAERHIQWEKEKGDRSRCASFVNNARRNGNTVIAVEQALKARSYESLTTKRIRKVMLIFGNEVKGIPKEILRLADVVAEIPMNGKKESLNVSVAAGIVIFRLLFP